MSKETDENPSPKKKLSRKERKQLEKDSYELKRARAHSIHWRESDLLATDYVPESDIHKNPLEGKEVPRWLVEKGFEMPFEVSNVYDGKQGRTHYWLTGPSKPVSDSGLVICVHGINGNRGVFEKTHEWLTLKGKHYVLSLDLFGHGLSENLKHKVSKKTYGIDFFTRQIFDLIKHLRIQEKRRTVVGFSMGGLIAAGLARQEPEMVDRCIFISPAFFVHKPKVVNLVKACASCIKCVNPCVPKCMLNKHEYETPTKRSSNELVNKQRNELINFHRRTALQLAVKGQVVDSFLGCVSQLPMWNAEEVIEPLGKHNIPTLLLWGRRDSVADIRQAERVLTFLPNAHLIVFPKTEHVVIAEKELETVCLILGFMTIPRHADMALWYNVLPISSSGRYVAINDRHPLGMPNYDTYHEELNYYPRYIVADERLRKREEQRYTYKQSDERQGDNLTKIYLRGITDSKSKQEDYEYAISKQKAEDKLEYSYYSSSGEIKMTLNTKSGGGVKTVS